MSAIKFELDAEVRQDVGRGASRRLRHTDKFPAVLYGAGEAPVSLVLDHNKALHALAHEAFYSHILTLTVGKKSEKVILKDVQRHPAKPRLLHIDFLRIKADQKLHMHIPFHFVGGEKAPGVKEGGVFSHLMSDVEVVCLPSNLPEYIEVDISDFVLNQTLHLSQVALPKDVELVAFAHGIEGHDLPVVTIHIPRIIEEVVPVVEAPAEGEGAEAAATTEGENAAPNAEKSAEPAEKNKKS